MKLALDIDKVFYLIDLNDIHSLFSNISMKLILD